MSPEQPGTKQEVLDLERIITAIKSKENEGIDADIANNLVDSASQELLNRLTHERDNSAGNLHDQLDFYVQKVISKLNKLSPESSAGSSVSSETTKIDSLL